MSSLTSAKVKQICVLISPKLFIIRTILCPTVQTNTTYTTIIRTITILSLFLSTYNLYGNSSSHTTIRYSDHNLFVSANLYSLEIHSGGLQTRNLS